MTAVEWTTFDRRPPGSNVSHDSNRQERRRLELAAHERRVHPDLAVSGTVAPYGVPLDDGRGNQITFSADTLWLDEAGHPLDDRAACPLQLEHAGRILGFAILHLREPGGLFVDGTIGHHSRNVTADRRHLSIGLGPFDTRRRPDGTLAVTIATLREVSLVRTARWAEHCGAAIWQRACA